MDHSLADLTVSSDFFFQISDLTLSILSYGVGQIAIADLVLSIFCLLTVRYSLNISCTFYYVPR